jgi:hypothetical protein
MVFELDGAGNHTPGTRFEQRFLASSQKKQVSPLRSLAFRVDRNDMAWLTVFKSKVNGKIKGGG